MPKAFWFGVIFVLLSSMLASALREPTTKVVIDGRTVPVEVVDSPSERVKGLSGRDTLLGAQGMLFVFEEPGFYSFWMKEMRFPLDIAWMNEEEVVHIERNIAPDTFPQSFASNVPARYVLEVNAGQLESWGIKVGDPMELVGI